LLRQGRISPRRPGAIRRKAVLVKIGLPLILDHFSEPFLLDQ
jgi:hypothetical protein